MKIEAPKHCPACGAETTFVNDQLFCTNQDCSAQVDKKVVKFCKVFGMKGFGEKQIEKFGFTGLFDALSTLVTVDRAELSNILGSSVMGEKLHNQLESIKQPVNLSTLIEALSIPSIGTVQAKKLAPYFPDQINASGLGPASLAKVTQWLEDNRSVLSLFQIKSEINVTEDTLVPVAITGKLSNKMTKAKAAEELRKLGFEVKSSLTKEVKFLICDTDQTSSSCEKARKYNIPIVTYISLIEGNN